MRVGRAAIDEDAIRLLERHNPDVQFDWPRLMKEAAPEPAPRRYRDGREGREGRDGREGRERRERREPRGGQRPRPMETSAVAVPPLQTPDAAEEMQALAEAAEARATEHAAALSAELAEAETSDFRATEYAEATEQQATESAEDTEQQAANRAPANPEPENLGTREPENLSAAALRLGADGVIRLRARYLDIVARLDEKPLEDAARAELRAAAERLNPDTWRTADEVALALEQYETVFESLRTVVGRHPRRRV